jgi:hypothetical protein
MKAARALLLVTLTTPIVMVVAAVIAFLVSSAHVSRVDQRFQAIAPNATKAEVVGLLGVPDQVRGCGENLWWGDDTKYQGPNDGRCLTEERYEFFLTAFGVGYSAEGKVVSKYRYVSE